MEGSGINNDKTNATYEITHAQTKNNCNVYANNPWYIPLRKYAYSNILKILPPKNENFQIKNFYILHISDQNIDCGAR